MSGQVLTQSQDGNMNRECFLLPSGELGQKIAVGR